MQPLYIELHQKLIEGAKRAAAHGKHGALTRYLRDIYDEKIVMQVTTWILRFGPVKRDPSRINGFQFSKVAREKMNLAEAEAMPFWTFHNDEPSASPSQSSTRKPRTTKERDPERDIQKNHIKVAMNRFLASPDHASRNNLFTQLEDYQIRWEGKSAAQYVSVVQGGLPSLSKRS